MDNQDIYSLARDMETSFTTENTRYSDYVEENMYQDLQKIDAYYNSRPTTGTQDSLGRDKPFFNIVVAAVNIWYRATDIDRRHIQLRAGKASQQLLAFTGTVLLQDWMKKSRFGSFLNEWGRTLAKYGSAVVQFVDKGDELSIEVCDWNRIICDQIDFENNPVIKKIETTPALLRMNEAYDQDLVEELIEESLQTRKDSKGFNRDDKSDFINIYEIHGKLPLSYLTGEEKDEKTYVQQMHVIAWTKTGKGRTKEYKNYTLYSGREKKSPFMLTHLIKEPGKTLSTGAVKWLFEPQWMINHTMKQMKDQLDMVSKIFYQTSDGAFVGQNVLSNMESGDILLHAVNQPLTQVNNGSHDLASLQNFAQQWKNLSQEITSTPDALLGNTMPSGTAWRQVEALQQEAHSLFEVMLENKGLAIEDMMREHIIPFNKRKMDTSDEIAVILSEDNIKWIDSIYVPSRAIKESNSNLIDKFLQGEELTPEMQTQDIQSRMMNIQKELSLQANQRFFVPSDVSDKTWKETLKDFEWDVEVDVTPENKDKQTVLTTLATVYRELVSKNDPAASLVLNKILSFTNAISPLELSQVSASRQQMQPMQSAVGGQVGGTQMVEGLAGTVQ